MVCGEIIEEIEGWLVYYYWIVLLICMEGLVMGVLGVSIDVIEWWWVEDVLWCS